MYHQLCQCQKIERESGNLPYHHDVSKCKPSQIWIGRRSGFFLTNGIRTQVSAANRISSFVIRNEPEELSVVTYDNLGNRV